MEVPKMMESPVRVNTGVFIYACVWLCVGLVGCLLEFAGSWGKLVSWLCPELSNARQIIAKTSMFFLSGLAFFNGLRVLTLRSAWAIWPEQRMRQLLVVHKFSLAALVLYALFLIGAAVAWFYFSPMRAH